MRKRSIESGADFLNARYEKALNNQGFFVSNMAEAMGFELMDLLQSTVFKTMTKASIFSGLWPKVFRFDCAQTSLGTAVESQ
jgi:hypothetical protein